MTKVVVCYLVESTGRVQEEVGHRGGCVGGQPAERDVADVAVGVLDPEVGP